MPPASPPAAPPGGDAGKKGLEFFAELNKAGNFVPVIGKSGTLAQGATPIVIWWDYNALSGRDALNGNPPIEVVVPKQRRGRRRLRPGDLAPSRRTRTPPSSGWSISIPTRAS